MINQSLIKSGFDLELLLGERYIKYFLLTSFETGSIPWWTRDVNEDTGEVTNIIIHPPIELEQNRLYEPHPDFVPHPFLDTVPFVYTEKPEAMEVTLLPDEEDADIRVQLIVSAIAPPLGPGFPPVVLTEQQMHIDARFFVQSDPLPSGFQGNVRLRLELVDIGGPFIDIASSLPGFDKDRTLARMKEEFDRDVPLSIVGEGGAIMQIETKKFFSEVEDDPPTCIGLYVNLNLRSGPEPTSFFGARGDLTLAENFLPKGHHMAFGFARDLYGKLSSDLKERMAAPKEGGGFYYPLDPEEPGLGKIVHAAVYAQSSRPDPIGGRGPHEKNVLIIEVEGEIFVDNFFDPNFTMKISLTPTFKDGILTFRTGFDLNIPSAGWLVVGFALLSFLSLNLAIPLTLATLAAKAIAEEVGEDIAAPLIDAQLKDASLLDAFPNKLAVESRRWDPMYETLHQVVSLVKEVAINENGMAFSAFDMRIGKEPKIRDDVVIRSEVRDDEGKVSGLLYRVTDLDQYVQEADSLFPATDRLDFVGTLPPDGGVEASRVHLSVDQAVDRIKNNRLLGEIPYTPYKIDEVENQIYQILTLSKKEVPEIEAIARDLLRRELRRTRGQEFRDRAREELAAELGRDPSDEEIETRFTQILNAEVDAAAAKRYRRERERYLKFDLEPSEYAELQLKKILVLEHHGLQIVKMKKRFGGTVYYRDRADTDKGDNLLFLPRYKSQRT